MLHRRDGPSRARKKAFVSETQRPSSHTSWSVAVATLEPSRASQDQPGRTANRCSDRLPGEGFAVDSCIARGEQPTEDLGPGERQVDRIGFEIGWICG